MMRHKVLGGQSWLPPAFSRRSDGCEDSRIDSSKKPPRRLPVEPRTVVKTERMEVQIAFGPLTVSALVDTAKAIAGDLPLNPAAPQSFRPPNGLRWRRYFA